jgi:hypothetical protein
MKPEIIDAEVDSRAIRRAASAGLLVASLDGTIRDAVMHYVAGAIAAKPNAAKVGMSFYRRVIFIEKPGGAVGALCADSVKRCERTVRVSRISGLHKELAVYLDSYEDWANS